MKPYCFLACGQRMRILWSILLLISLYFGFMSSIQADGPQTIGDQTALCFKEEDQQRAINVIKAHAGKYERSTPIYGEPVVAVVFSGATLDDDVFHSLRNLPYLTRIELRDCQGVTPSALARLSGLRLLHELGIAPK